MATPFSQFTSAHRLTITAGHRTALLLILLLLVTSRCVRAQSPPPPGHNSKIHFNLSLAIVILILISAFFLLGVLTIYIRHCFFPDATSLVLTAEGARTSRRQRGLDAEVLSSFPTLVYSQVKEHKIGKGTLECAVCLSEFEDDETLRLIPACDHVFHPDCIDAWLASHVTCPICRTVLLPDTTEPRKSLGAPPENGITIDRAEEEEQLRAEEADVLERIKNMKRAKSRARPASFPRSHTTGHSLVQPGDDLERFTLRLPENVKEEIRLRRAKSLAEVGLGRAGRQKQLGWSNRWPSVLLQTLGSSRGGDGSTKGGKVTVAVK